MIQIFRDNFDELAEEHYVSIKPMVLKRLNHYGGPVFTFLLKNLETVLKGTPLELQEEIIDKIPKPSGKDLKRINIIFDYGAFTAMKKYGAYKLAKNLNVNTCPYCNRLYTFTIDTKSGKTRPEFDHFYNKATYPYLALSFYNLIPSCHICNSSLKGSANFSINTHIHPYVEGFNDDVKFHIKLGNNKKPVADEISTDYGIGFFYGSLDSFTLKLSIDNPSATRHLKANENIKRFKLEELYNGHRDYVIEIVQKAIVYNKEYIDELAVSFSHLFRDSYDVKRMLLSNYTSIDDLDKRVLSKLTKDVSEEFGLN